MNEFNLNGLSFYCDTLDITRPYPSLNNVLDYNLEFCWNDFVTKEFERIGLRQHCCVLLCGLAVGKLISTKEHQVTISLITKRSSYNPGTRYIGRGLNTLNSPGNEYEYEIVVYKTKEKDNCVNWSSVIGRRGTVPIRWRSELVSQFADAQIFLENDPFKGVEKYYQRMNDTYNNISLTCVSLLRGKTVHPEESNLQDYFEESLKLVKKQSNLNVNLISFDWLHTNKHYGIETATNSLWKLVYKNIKEYGVNSGVIKNEKKLDSKILKNQQGLFRVNCADSLDRTNLSIFFITIVYMNDLLKNIGVESLTNNIDFSEDDLNLEFIKKNYNEFLVLKLAEIFVQNGDVCSLLFTNTVAMHTEYLRLFAQHLPEAPSNTKILVERRIQNTIFDKNRNTQSEIFLGQNWEKYFPDFMNWNQHGAIRFVSPYPSFIFKQIPCQFDFKCSDEFCLLKTSTKYAWICPKDHDYVELYVYLPSYCRITEFAITIRHGITDQSSPSKLDVFVGTYIDDNNVGYQELILPKCEDSTKLLYSLPNQSGLLNSNLYNFYGKMKESNYDNRVIRLMFYGLPQGLSMTLGPIQIFGVENERKVEDKKNEILLKFDDDDNKKKEDNKKEYVKMLKENPTFTEALILDSMRLKFGITTQERDDILVNKGFKVKHFDPNQFVYKRDDKIETLVRKQLKTSKCHQCNTSLGFTSHSCRYCNHTFCKNCFAKDKIGIIEYKWTSPQSVCQGCFDIILKQNELIKDIRVLVEKEKAEKKTDIFHKFKNRAFTEKKNLCLSEFPLAGILSSVETHEKSPPIETILFPDSKSYWFAPLDVNNVNIIIVLPCYSKISKILLITDQLGYYGKDLPEIFISTSEKLPKFDEQKQWKLINKELKDDELAIQPDEKVELSISSKCRLIRFSLSLKKGQQLHLGRIMIFGECLPLNETPIKLQPQEHQLYDNILQIKPKTTRIQLKVDTNKTIENGILDIPITDNSLISGFQITVKHDDGINSQVREVRVTLINDKSNVLGVFVIPKVFSGTSLYYDFEKTFEGTKTIRFEFLNNYGGSSISVGKIFLFYNALL